MEMDELTFYHGSPVYLEDGVTIIPGSESGNGERMEDVYVTPIIGLAQQYATWDGYIYMVQPSDDLKGDFKDDKGNHITYTCSSAKVVCCVW